MSKSDVQKGCQKVTSKRDVENWCEKECQKVMSKSYVKKHAKVMLKVASKSDVQQET